MKKLFSKASFFALICFIAFSSCSSLKKASYGPRQAKISGLKFLDEYTLPQQIVFENTWVGGLSGIDFDVKKNEYYMISDDPSQYSPARFYTAKIEVVANKIDTIVIKSVRFLHQEDGSSYPKYEKGINSKADGEAIRFNPKRNTLIWSNEGERLYRPTDTTIVQPALTFISTEGKFLDTIPLPTGFHITKQEYGMRKNAFFEGLTYADDYNTIYASLEEPLYQDGRQSHFGFDNALVRIVKFDAETKRTLAQYAYTLDAIPIKPTEENDWNVNGVSEILALDSKTLLVVERAWAKGRDDHTFVRLYLADLSNAEDVKNNGSFVTNRPKSINKKLLFDFDSLDMHIDNVEGVTLGPKLPNGHQTLIFCVDNNFAKTQVQQFFLFEIIP